MKKAFSGGKGGGTKSEEVKIEIGKNRFVTVSEFKGKTLIQIREYYEKNGELLPGKKGFALSVDQWETLKSLIPDIDEALE